jgi:heptosyltransferase-2
MALPTIQQLQHCGFVLRLVGRAWAKDLLAGLNVPVTTLPQRILAASRVLRTIKLHHGLLFTNSLSSALSMRLAGIRAIGYRSDMRSSLLHAVLEKSLVQHEVETFWRLGKAAIDCWNPSEMRWPDTPPQQIHLPLSNAHRAAAARALSLAKINGPYVVCCPMAMGTNRGQSKQWPQFAEFCRIQAGAGRTLVICPGPGELPKCEGFRDSAVILPDLSLGTYAAVLAGAEMVVANDSGPMHMAAAVGTPVLGIFGRSDPLRTFPWGGQFIGSAEQWPDVDSVLSACDEMSQTRRRLPRAG